jgi:hypothetical protein
MLAPFTFTPEPLAYCYILGCYEVAIISRLHRRFGPVSSCAGHDPERTAYAKPFGNLAPSITVKARELEPPNGGGYRVPVKRPDPVMPPGGAIADPF